MFHDNTSSKLDNRVEFPLTGLSLQPYVDSAGDASVAALTSSDSAASNCSSSSNELEYDLYGVVCHFGSKLPPQDFFFKMFQMKFFNFK